MIQQDVSDVTLSGDRMWLEGTSAIIDPRCVQVFNLSQVETTAEGFAVLYEIVPKNSEGCPTKTGSLSLAIMTA